MEAADCSKFHFVSHDETDPHRRPQGRLAGHRGCRRQDDENAAVGNGKAYWLDKDPVGEQHGDLNRGTAPMEVIAVEIRK